MKNRAQVSMEYLLIVGFAMLLTAPLLILYANQSNYVKEGVQKLEAEKAADQLVDSANTLYYSGSGSKRTLEVILPEGVEGVVLNNNLISIQIDGPNGYYEVNRWSDGNLTGSINNYAGTHRLTITNNDGLITINEE